jgi:hypothetical protein
MAVTAVTATEVQDHGYAFEKLVIRQLTGGDLVGTDYTAEWDIPAAKNPRTGLPVSVKFAEWKNSVYLGDAIRQFKIDHAFELVVGFYEPDRVRGRAKIVAVHHLTFQPERWRSFWGAVELGELEVLARVAKAGTIDEAQEAARPLAAELREKSGIISIHPKINKDQRRIQCSIPFTRFYGEVLKLPAEPQMRLELFGREFPGETPWSTRP